MDWLEQIEFYLCQRLLTSYPTDAINLLNRYPIAMNRMSDFVTLGFHNLDARWEEFKEKKDDPLEYRVKLTVVAASIGEQIMSTIKCSKEFQIDTFVKIGDFILEGFFALGYIDIILPPPRSRTPVMIRATDKWEKDIECKPRGIIKGLSDTPPGKLKNIQRVKFKDGLEWEIPTIKKWKEEDEVIFNTCYANTPAVKAAERLSNTGWILNQRVLEAVKAHKFRFDNRSNRIAHDYTLDYADQIGSSIFYYTPEFDWRGRLYFTMPYLNFQGSDTGRGLLLFSEKKYVNENGLRWMKIHAASSYNQSYNKHAIPEWCTSDYKAHLEDEGLDDISVDKMTLRDRELWVDNNMELICETAQAGIIHDCEKPVSFLAVAIEIDNYMQTDIYFSHLPIPVDGSNNGWQHLGAISKDTQTGNLVGLVPRDIQQDFYVQTAKMLKELTTNERRVEILKTMPMKHIRKGISKRGSMTRAYSAGAQKIAVNMYQDCKKEGFHLKYGITEEDCEGFAKDLVKAIAAVCPGPLETMTYLQRLVDSQIQEGATDVFWSTPSGFGVNYVCPHLVPRKVTSRIKGVNPNSRDQIKHVVQLKIGKVDKRGFMCGISPNFIHSQDAAHMHLVINRFDRPFGAVHDSFSAHASDVDELLEITKEVFIEMYDHPNYFHKIKDKIGGTADEPALGTLNIKEVNDSDYFFA